jgi:Rieske Fe-S protein
MPFRSYYTSCSLGSILDANEEVFASAGKCPKSYSTVNINQSTKKLWLCMVTESRFDLKQFMISGDSPARGLNKDHHVRS